MEAATGETYFRAGVQKLDVPVRAPEFTLRQLGNGMISLQGLRGKVVLLNFFSPSCPICQEEATSFDTLGKKFREGKVVILQVAVEADEAELMNFKKEYHISLPILIDEERRTAKAYGVWGHQRAFSSIGKV